MYWGRHRVRNRSGIELYKEMFKAITDLTELIYSVFLNAQFAFE